MFHRIFIAAMLALSLSGCITVYEYGADTDSDDYYYSEPSIDRYDYSYSGNYGPYYDRYYDPYYDRFGYRRYGGWSGSIGYSFGDGAFSRYGFPYWYFGYGYGYGHGYPYNHYRPHRYYGHGDNNHRHRPPQHRPPPQRPPGEVNQPPGTRPPGERRPPRLVEREDAPGRRLQDLGRPVPDVSTAPRLLNGSMPRIRPAGRPQPSEAAPRAVLARPSPSQGGFEPRAEAPPPPRPAPMPSRRFERGQDSSESRPAPAPRPEASEREVRPEPK